MFSMFLNLLILMFCLLVCAPANAAQELPAAVKYSFDERRFLISVTEKFIQPKHSEFEQSVVNLDQQAKLFCAKKSAATWASLQSAWSDSMDKWMNVHLVNYGPIDDSNLAWRFQFWPDPMNLVARKLKSRVKGRNKKISPEQMAKASVAIQGLSALEYLLFDEQLFGEKPPYKYYEELPQLCTLVLSSINNLLTNAKRLKASWYGDYQLRWLNQKVQAGNPKYFRYNIEKVFSGMTMAVGMSYRDRVGKAIGIKKGDQGENIEASPNPYLLESWRSRQSIENIKNTLISVRGLYRLEGSFSDILINLKNDEAANLDIEIKKQLDHALALLSDLKTSAYDAIREGRTEAFVKLYHVLKDLHINLKVRYTQLIGIQFRFNAHDGD